MRKTILILGGGVGGVVAANELRRRLPKEHRVIVIERETTFAFAPSFLWLLVGDRTERGIVRPLAKLEAKGIEVVRGEIERIDPVERAVTVGDRTIAADHLIVALGAELAPESIPGLREAGHDFYTLQGSMAFRDAFDAFRGGRLVVLTATPAYKCPAAPYEAAMLIEDACRRRGIRPATEIALYAAEPGPMGVAGPDVSKAVRQMVEAKEIAYYPEHQLKAVRVGDRTLEFSNGSTTTYDLLAYVPPHRAPTVVRESGLCGESGWIAVDRHSLETRWPNVHAIGDVVSIPLALGKPLPKAGVFAHAEAEVVAENIARSITGTGVPASFDGEGECFIETGGGKAGFGKGNFYAEPLPDVKVHPPARRWHAAKVLFEKSSLWRWF